MYDDRLDGRISKDHTAKIEYLRVKLKKKRGIEVIRHLIDMAT